MKRKLFLSLILTAVIALALAICVSAYTPNFGDVIEVEGMAEDDIFGDDGRFETHVSRVLMSDGKTYPSYYILNNNATFSVSFKELNKALGLTGDAEYKRQSVICLEICDGVTTIPNCYSASGEAIFWGDKYTSTIEYIKMPSTLTSLSTDAPIFSMKALKFIDFAESQVQEFPARALYGASSLEQIIFPKTLKTLKDNSLYGCSSLKIADFSETALEIVGYRSMFECKGLEEVRFSPTLKKIETQSFYKAGTSSDKSIVVYYIPATLEEIYNQFGTIWQDSKTPLIYFTGTNEAQGMSQIQTNGGGKWTLVDSKSFEFDADAVSSRTIAYNYSLCDAFYNGAHIDGTVIVYEDYSKEGLKRVGCKREGCLVGESKAVAPLIKCYGYSVPIDGNGGVSVKYRVNEAELADYEATMKVEISYGLFATTKKKLGAGDIINEDGTMNENVFAADMTDCGYQLIEIKLVGFGDNDKEKAFAIGAFVVTKNNGVATYSYIQDGTPLENEKYCFVSYNDLVKEK